MSHRAEQIKEADQKGGDIPRLYLQGDIEGMWERTDVRKVTVEYQDGDRVVTSYAMLKPQGDSSIVFSKRSYNIKLYQDENCTRKKQVNFGWGSESRYCLKANWTDKTHARNIVSARLAAEIQEKYNVLESAPHNGLIDGYPIEVYSNNDFLGLYTLNIPKNEWLFGMDEEKKNHLVFESQIYGLAGAFETLPDYETWEIEVGKESDKNLEKLFRLFSFVLNSSDKEFREHFSEYLDLDATMTYFIMVNLGMMEDNVGKNMLLATYDGQLWYPSLYDMDASWGVNYLSQKESDYTWVPVSDYSRLLRRVRENFPAELTQRYFELRESILTREHIMQTFYDFKQTIPEQALVREQEAWKDIPGYDYDQIEEYLDVRLPVMDAYMKSLGA